MKLGINNQDPFSNWKWQNTSGTMSQWKWFKDTETSKIKEGVNSLNSKQREVFNVTHIWAKDYIKYGINVKPVHIFLSGIAYIDKSHLVKVIHKK